MATFKVLDRYGAENIQQDANNVNLASSNDGFTFTKADWTKTAVTFVEIDSTTNNPKIQVQVWGTTVYTIPLNKNDIQIDNAGSDFDLTDDQLTFSETNGDSATISFAKYNITATANADGDIEISQNGSLLSTISQNAIGIAYDNTTSGLSATNLQDAVDEVVDDLVNLNTGTEQQDDFVATSAQTSFTLTQTPNGQVNITRNGIMLTKACISVSGATVTYDPAQNGSSALVAGDRVSFTYEY